MSYKKEEINESKIVGLKLRELRKNAGYKARHLAQDMGYSERTIFDWETGKRTLSLEILYSYCEWVGVDPKTILP